MTPPRRPARRQRPGWPATIGLLVGVWAVLAPSSSAGAGCSRNHLEWSVGAVDDDLARWFADERTSTPHRRRRDGTLLGETIVGGRGWSCSPPCLRGLAADLAADRLRAPRRRRSRRHLLARDHPRPARPAAGEDPRHGPGARPQLPVRPRRDGDGDLPGAGRARLGLHPGLAWWAVLLLSSRWRACLRGSTRARTTSPTCSRASPTRRVWIAAVASLVLLRDRPDVVSRRRLDATREQAWSDAAPAAGRVVLLTRNPISEAIELIAGTTGRVVVPASRPTPTGRGWRSSRPCRCATATRWCSATTTRPTPGGAAARAGVAGVVRRDDGEPVPLRAPARRAVRRGRDAGSTSCTSPPAWTPAGRRPARSRLSVVAEIVATAYGRSGGPMRA